MKPLPHFIMEDGEYWEATPKERAEWNARIAMGCEPEDLSLTGPLNLPGLEPLPLLCSQAKHDAATPEQQRDLDKRLMQKWREDRESQIADEDERDRKFSFLGE